MNVRLLSFTLHTAHRSGLVDECAESAVSLLASAPSLPDSLWLALRRLNPLLVQADHHFAQPPVLPDTSNGNDPPASITSSQPFALSEPTGPSVKSPVRSPPARSSSSYPLAEEDVGPAIDSSLHRICSLAILPTPSGSSVVRGGMSSPQDSPRLGSLGQVTPLPSDLSLTPNRHSRKQSGEDVSGSAVTCVLLLCAYV